jgi:2-methylcitrate dehydratase PrpD
MLKATKTMILDSIGVGTIGSQTEIAGMLREFAIETNGTNSKSRSLVWGTENLKMSSPMGLNHEQEQA